jgi:hypothetical protein
MPFYTATAPATGRVENYATGGRKYVPCPNSYKKLN